MLEKSFGLFLCFFISITTNAMDKQHDAHTAKKQGSNEKSIIAARQELQTIMHHKSLTYSPIQIVMRRTPTTHQQAEVHIEMSEEIRPSRKARCCRESLKACCCLGLTLATVSSFYFFKATLGILREELGKCHYKN